MRELAAGEDTILNSADRRVGPEVEIQNVDGTWKNLSNLSGTGFANLDFGLGVDWGTGIDEPTWTGSVRLGASAASATGTKISISPYMESSPANVDDGSAPAPLIDGMRRVRWFTRTSLLTGALGTRHKVFDGYVVEVDHDNDEINLSVSDLGHLLVVTQIESERVYDAGLLLEELIQKVLDDNFGVGVIPLVVDASITAEPIVLSSKTKVNRDKVMEAIRNLAQNTVGAVVRYMWNGEDMELRLFVPPRGSTTSLFTYGPNRVFPESNFRVKTDDIRNAGGIYYQDADKQAVVSAFYEVPESIALYKRRYFEFTEGATSQINSEAEAVRFLTAAITDLAQPKAEGAYGAPYNWAADVYDLYTFSANGVHFTSDQLHAITRVSHSIAETATTRLETRGNVAGYSRRWIAVEGNGPRPKDQSGLTAALGMGGEGSMFGGQLFGGATDLTPDGCVWPFLFIGQSIKRVHIWHRESAPGSAIVLWPPTSSDMYKAVTLERPEGDIPRDGNFTFGVSPELGEFSGRTVWRVVMPLPTTPNSIAGVIIQTETFDGRFGPQQRLSAVATDSGSDPGGVAGLAVVRTDATTVRVQLTPENSPSSILVFRDGINIDQIDNLSPVAIEWFDTGLHAGNGYKYDVCALGDNISGWLETVFIEPWTTSLAFADGTPDTDDDPVLGLRVKIGWTGLPGGTAKVQIQKSLDGGHYDPWSVAATVDPSPALYYDRVVLAAQGYRIVALDASDVILDSSISKYWTNPFGQFGGG